MNEENKNNPLLSVIIPCYKVEKYLDRCMESVVNQTYRNLEIILVNDGSPDNTGKMCDDWAERDPRIKVVHKENGGLGFARNSGMEFATGEWLAFVDSDDYTDITMYEKLMQAVLSTDSDIAYCGHTKQMSDGSEIIINNYLQQIVFEKSALPNLSRGFYSPIPEAPKMLTMAVWHAVYRRKVCNTPFLSEREVGSEDVHFQISAMLASKRVVFIPDALVTYCYNGESLSHTFLFEKFARYKKLAGIIRSTYLEYGLDYRFDYYVFVMACGTIGQMMASSASKNVKIEYIYSVVNDSFWDNCDIGEYKMPLRMRVFLMFLKSHSPLLMYMTAWTYRKILHFTQK